MMMMIFKNLKVRLMRKIRSFSISVIQVETSTTKETKASLMGRFGGSYDKYPNGYICFSSIKNKNLKGKIYYFVLPGKEYPEHFMFTSNVSGDNVYGENLCLNAKESRSPLCGVIDYWEFHTGV